MTRFTKGEVPEPTSAERRKRAGNGIEPFSVPKRADPLLGHKPGVSPGNPSAKFVPMQVEIKKPARATAAPVYSRGLHTDQGTFALCAARVNGKVLVKNANWQPPDVPPECEGESAGGLACVLSAGQEGTATRTHLLTLE